MEENKKNTEGEKKSSSNPGNPLEGIDFSKLLQNEHIVELLKHLLSGGGAMAGSYFFWIKPMQDKIETMNVKLVAQETRIKELETDHDKLVEQLDNEKRQNDDDLKGSKEEFFSIKRNTTRAGNNRHRNVHF